MRFRARTLKATSKQLDVYQKLRLKMREKALTRKEIRAFKTAKLFYELVFYINAIGQPESVKESFRMKDLREKQERLDKEFYESSTYDVWEPVKIAVMIASWTILILIVIKNVEQYIK